MKQWKVTTYEPYSYVDEKVFTNKKDMLAYVEANEATVVKLEETTTKDVMSQYVNLSNKTYYQVNVNVMVDDEWYCSSVDDQWGFVVLADSKKEAEEKALQQAQEMLERANETYKYLEVVNSFKAEYDDSEKYPRWKKVR